MKTTCFPITPSNLRVSPRLLKLYLNSNQLSRARQLFDESPHPDLHSLTTLISAYNHHNLPHESINLYRNLRKAMNIRPDKLVLRSIAKAISLSPDLAKARDLHRDVIDLGFASDILIGNMLINMYAKCGSVDGAKRVFVELPEKDVVTWTSLISAYSGCGMKEETFQVFREMTSSGPMPNTVTLSTVLPICSELKGLNFGREIHCFAVRNGFEGNVFVSSGLVDMYSKCLSMRQARAVFDSMLRKDVVSWNVILASYFANGDSEEALKVFERMKFEKVGMDAATWNSMIGGCAENGRTEQAFSLLGEMQGSGVKPNHITIVSILPACTNVESIRGGKEIHGFMYRHRFMEDIVIATSLVLMYAKCGDLDKSRVVFARIARKDIIAWNTMILATSMHGCGEEGLSLFNQMIASGIRPNSVSFVGVLSGCSHSHLVDEARAVFDSMSREYGLKPDAEHYGCMVDVLSRSGHLNEAYEFIQNAPMKLAASAWGALLGGCKVYKNVELGWVAAKVLFEIEPENSGNYALLSNILVGSKMWDDASKIRMTMRDKGVRKMPGSSWVQIKNKVYTFVKGDWKMERRKEVYRFLEEIGEKMRAEGYKPDTDFVLQDVDVEEKEKVLCDHSEKLAVAFGLLNLDAESVVRVFKNLRICGDCHNAIKFMATIAGVQITVRDNVRFHHFKDGYCSCRDLW